MAYRLSGFGGRCEDQSRGFSCMRAYVFLSSSSSHGPWVNFKASGGVVLMALSNLMIQPTRPKNAIAKAVAIGWLPTQAPKLKAMAVVVAVAMIDCVRETRSKWFFDASAQMNEASVDGESVLLTIRLRSLSRPDTDGIYYGCTRRLNMYLRVTLYMNMNIDGRRFIGRFALYIYKANGAPLGACSLPERDKIPR